MFSKKTLKDSRKLKRIRNYASKWNLYVFLDMWIYICGFLVKKSTDISRTQGVCHVIYIDFESSLGKV